ncbi:Plasma membrane t-SNARE, secretory vesicle fusion [Rhizoclosmatium sp. JEL0117]|nr:Plasma membrane t-SNARE, secretory vesicle fusion [Rhizoclosmatium sp. JEL0117]
MSSRGNYDSREREPRYPPATAQRSNSGSGGGGGGGGRGVAPAPSGRAPRGNPQGQGYSSNQQQRPSNNYNNNNNNYPAYTDPPTASNSGRDRLGDLRAGSASPAASFNSNPTQNDHRRGQPSRSNTQTSATSNTRFYDDIDAMRNDLDHIQRQLIPDLQALQQKIISTTHQAEADRATSQMNAVQDNISAILNDARKTMRALSASTANMPPGAESHSRKGQLGTMAKKLMAVADDFASVQKSFKSKYKQRMEREIRIARPDATPQEIARALDSNTGSAFSQQLLASRNDKARKALNDVQNRHTELQKIEQSMTEVFELFQEMQALIETQQEMINNVESNVENTVQYVEEGSKELSKAVVYRKQARKKKWWLAIIIGAVLIVVLVFVYIYVIKPMISK